MPVAGYNAYLVHQIGKQSAINTPVAATRRVPFVGAIKIDPQWDFGDPDLGSLDVVQSPTRRGLDVTGTWEVAKLTYNDAACLWALTGEGSNTPSTSGGAYFWTFNPASSTVDTFDWATDEWYDDATTDTVRAYGGTIEDLTITYPDDLGPLTASASLRYAGVDVGSPTSPTAPTAGLTGDFSPVYIYAADTEFYVNSTVGAIGTTKWTDTFHGGSIHVTTEIEQKKFANGSNTRFRTVDYGRVSRTVTAEFRFAKNANSVAEVANLLNTAAVDRFLRVKTVSPTDQSYHTVDLAGHWTARDDDQIGGNDIIVLSLQAKATATNTVYLTTIRNLMPTLFAAT